MGRWLIVAILDHACSFLDRTTGTACWLLNDSPVRRIWWWAVIDEEARK